MSGHIAKDFSTAVVKQLHLEVLQTELTDHVLLCRLRMYLGGLTHWEERVVDRGRGDMCLVCGRSNGPGISSGDI